ncbi:Nucleoid occlusion protein [subsurface metagenome]
MPKALALRIKEIELVKIDEPKGVIRLEIDPGEIASLAENIEEVGLLLPINVRAVADRFEIVAGHRRFLAFQKLKRKKIPCIVGVFSDVDSALARASENLGRVDLSLIEEAAIYSDLYDKHGLSCDKIGKIMGKSGGVVKRRLDLLKMPPQLQKAVHKKQISYSVAEELWSLGDEAAIDYFLGYAIDHGVTQTVARGWVNDWKKGQRSKEGGTVGSGGGSSPAEARPIYIVCDLCLGPLELGKEHTIRACGKCASLITAAIADKMAD